MVTVVACQICTWAPHERFGEYGAVVSVPWTLLKLERRKSREVSKGGGDSGTGLNTYASN